MGNNIKFRYANESDSDLWNEFIIRNTPNAQYSLYNLFEWRKVLTNSYNYKSYYIIAEQNSKIISCFPLIYVKSAIFGNRLISLPFTDHGCGPSIETDNAKFIICLLDKVNKIANTLGVQSVQVNSPLHKTGFYEFGYKKHYEYFTFLLNLKLSSDEIWNTFNKRIRNNIRKAQKYGVEIIVDLEGNYNKTIYEIHTDNMKYLGSPPHSMVFFQELWTNLNPKGLIMNYIAKYNGENIGAITLFPHRDTVRWGIGVSLAEYRKYNAISLLLWEAIKGAQMNGYSLFDFGGSRVNSGNFLFKKNWLGKDLKNGWIDVSDHLYLFLNKKEKIINPDLPKYAWISKQWKKYMFKSMANYIGPRIRKQLAA